MFLNKNFSNQDSSLRKFFSVGITEQRRVVSRDAFDFSRFFYTVLCLEYRNARAGKAGAGVYTFTESFAESQTRQQNHTKTQKQEHEEYLKRVREFG